MFDSAYLLFRGESLTHRGGEVVVPHSGGQVLIPADDFQLAQLFDGSRSLAAVIEEAALRFNRSIGATSLRAFVAELGSLGLMRSGRFEPLPTLPQTDEERQMPQPADTGGRGVDGPQLPSTLPGSLAQPALIGAVTYRGFDLPGEAARMDAPVAIRWVVALGEALVWPLRSRFTMALFGVFAVVALTVLIDRRDAWSVFSRRFLPGPALLVGILAASWVVNLCSMSARAAAVARFTGQRPQAGIRFAWWVFPYLFTDTSGAPERASLADRLRVVGAGLVGSAVLMTASIYVWLMCATTTPALAMVAWSTGAASIVSVLLRLNPLARRDGYFLLANWAGTLDLRRQAFGALFGIERPWMTQPRRFSRRLLASYAVLVGLFTLASVGIIVWVLGVELERRFQGTGIVVLLVAWGVLMAKEYSRVAVDVTALGAKKWRLRLPTPKEGGIGLALLLVALIPYPYTPSGGFEALPRVRAEVSALTPGEVREILAAEGDLLEAGQAILRIDDTAQRAKVAASEAQRASLDADLALTRRGAKSEEIEVARQRVATARAAANSAETAFQRVSRAFRTKSVTAQDFDRARGAAEVAREELVEAQRSLDLVSSPAQQERLESLEADIRRVDAELEWARKELESTQVNAPIAGRLVAARLMFSRGDYLERGDLVATIEDTSELLAEIRLPESSVGGIVPGADVSAKFWAYPGRTFGGEVRSVAPSAEDGNYGRVVRIQVVVKDPESILKPGMTGNAKVSAGWKPMIEVFTRALVRFVMVELWSWIP